MEDEFPRRREKFPFGLAHLGLDVVEREIPADEPPPLAPNARLTQIGKDIRRWDARAKVTGAARYTVDVRLPGMLHAAVLRSPLPHARVLSLDLSPAAAAPGVLAVLSVVQPLALPFTPINSWTFYSARSILRYGHSKSDQAHIGATGCDRNDSSAAERSHA